LAALAGATCIASAQDYELAKQRVNALAHLATATFQFNSDCCFGSYRVNRGLLSNQFVAPFDISPDWFILSRTVIPVSTAPAISATTTSHSGVGDTLQSFFFSPRNSGAVSWGIGPAFALPTATDGALGAEKWGLGPTITLVYQTNGWTFGLLSHHIWSYAGVSDRRDLNYTYVQTGIAYTFPDTTGIGLGTETLYDWKTQQWSVPLILGVGHLYHLGTQPVHVGVTGKYYVATPIDGPKWGARATIVFLFPRK